MVKTVGGGYLLKYDEIYYIFEMDRTILKKELIDYKFYCFDGEPLYLYVSEGLDNHETARITFMTIEWERAQFQRNDYSTHIKPPTKPNHFDKMVEIARALSKGHPFLRVDLYEINGMVYFGECTFAPCGGYMQFVPDKYDYAIGNLLRLPEIEG